jgi:hypothetical protein
VWPLAANEIGLHGSFDVDLDDNHNIIGRVEEATSPGGGFVTATPDWPTVIKMKWGTIEAKDNTAPKPDSAR